MDPSLRFGVSGRGLQSFFAIVMAMLIPLNALASDSASSTLPLPATGNVTLTLAEYDRLMDLAAKAAKKHEAPPIAYAIKHADLKLHVTNDTVLGTVVEEGEVFSKGAAKVPLTSGLTIFNARQQGKALPLFEEGSMATAVLPGAAEFSVALDAGLPLNIEAGRASFNLPAPPAGSVRLALVIPGDHTNVHISPGLITGRTSSNGQTMVEATLQPGQPASIWWQTREIAAPAVPKEVRFLSDVKTLVSVGEADLRIATLCDVTVVQGDPSEFKLTVPADYQVTDVSGSTVEGSEIAGNELTVKLSATAPRSHQFLISMEKQLAGATKMEVPFVAFNNTQRETGELLVEGAGAMELAAKESGGLKRMDLKEVSPYLRSLSHLPLQAAFRFHRQPGETPELALDWVRFPDSSVLAAVAERAVVTTMVTSEGRSLTEVKLIVKNQAQPFLKVDLPQGASILSADVAGEKVKPVQGTDGARVPLLRNGFRPTDAYEVSFVFLHSGAPFARKGGSELSLPSMDVPISVLEWEVYLPEQYKVKDFGGDAIVASLLPNLAALDIGAGSAVDLKTVEFDRVTQFDKLARMTPGVMNPSSLLPGQVGGVITDPQGAVISGAVVRVTTQSGATQTTTTDANGRWLLSGIPSGTVKFQASAPGFQTSVGTMAYDTARAVEQNMRLHAGAASESIEVNATNANGPGSGFNGSNGRDKLKRDETQQASVNVFNLQKKVAGVLPVRVDVPRAGASYRFARTLVLDEETKLTFSYRTK